MRSQDIKLHAIPISRSNRISRKHHKEKLLNKPVRMDILIRVCIAYARQNFKCKLFNTCYICAFSTLIERDQCYFYYYLCVFKLLEGSKKLRHRLQRFHNGTFWDVAQRGIESFANSINEVVWSTLKRQENRSLAKRGQEGPLASLQLTLHIWSCCQMKRGTLNRRVHYFLDSQIIDMFELILCFLAIPQANWNLEGIKASRVVWWQAWILNCSTLRRDIDHSTCK